MVLEGDEAIIAYSAAFRRAALQGSSSSRMCAALSAPLYAALRLLGVECGLEESHLQQCNHVFLRLADGRVLDVTADQFTMGGNDAFAAVYLGPRRGIHLNATAWPGENEWPALMAELKRLYPEFPAVEVGRTVGLVLRSLPAGLVKFDREGSA